MENGPRKLVEVARRYLHLRQIQWEKCGKRCKSMEKSEKNHDDDDDESMDLTGYNGIPYTSFWQTHVDVH